MFAEGVLGRPKRTCALKGTSVNLSCSGDHSSTPKWYTLVGETWTEVPGNGTGIKYTISKGAQLTLSLMDVNKDDKKSYCCTNNPRNCEEDQIELIVTGKLDDSD